MSLVGSKRLGLAACPIQGGHQLSDRAFPEGVLSRQGLEFAGQLSGLTETQPGIKAQFESFEA